MRKRMLIIAVAITILSLEQLAFAEEHNLSGRWSGTLQRGDREGTVVMDLIPVNGKMTGHLSDPSGNSMTIHNWQVADERLTFDVDAMEGGHPKTIHFVGEVHQDFVRFHSQLGGKEGPTITLHRDRL